MKTNCVYLVLLIILIGHSAWMTLGAQTTTGSGSSTTITAVDNNSTPNTITSTTDLRGKGNADQTSSPESSGATSGTAKNAEQSGTEPTTSPLSSVAATTKQPLSSSTNIETQQGINTESSAHVQTNSPLLSDGMTTPHSATSVPVNGPSKSVVATKSSESTTVNTKSPAPGKVVTLGTSFSSEPLVTVTTHPSRSSGTATIYTSTPSETVTTHSSRSSGTATIHPSTPSETVALYTSTPSETVTTHPSRSSGTATIYPSTPSETVTIHPSTSSETVAIYRSTPSETATTHISTPSETATKHPSTPTETLTAHPSTSSETVALYQSTPSETVTIYPSKTSEAVTIHPSTSSETVTIYPSKTSEAVTIHPSSSSETVTIYPSKTSEAVTIHPSTSSETVTIHPSTSSETVAIYPSTSSETVAIYPSTSSEKITLHPSKSSEVKTVNPYESSKDAKTTEFASAIKSTIPTETASNQSVSDINATAPTPVVSKANQSAGSTKPSSTTSTTTSTVRATTNGPPDTYVKEADKDISIPMALYVNAEFLPDLKKPKSPTYKEYEKNFSAYLTALYNGTEGFTAINITGFRSGSILASYVVVLNNVTNITQALDSVNETLNHRLGNTTWSNQFKLSVDHVRTLAFVSHQLKAAQNICLLFQQPCDLGYTCKPKDSSSYTCESKCSKEKQHCGQYGECIINHNDGEAKCRCKSDDAHVYSGEHCEISTEKLKLGSKYIIIIGASGGAAFLVIIVVLVICLVKVRSRNKRAKRGRKVGDKVESHSMTDFNSLGSFDALKSRPFAEDNQYDSGLPGTRVLKENSGSETYIYSPTSFAKNVDMRNSRELRSNRSGSEYNYIETENAYVYSPTSFTQRSDISDFDELRSNRTGSVYDQIDTETKFEIKRPNFRGALYPQI